MTAGPDVVAGALEQLAQGFAVFALRADDKRPITDHGFKNATRDPAWARKQLEAPPAGNYGMTWPTDADGIVVAFDLDDGKDGRERPWQDRLTDLMTRLGPLPKTKATTTPSGGRHAFYRWPADVPVPPGDELFGFTVRWPGRGYLVGPGSSIRGVRYVAGPVQDIAPLPDRWVEAAVAEHGRRRSVSDAFLTVQGSYVLPERIPAGRRYATVRDYTASRYNSGLSSEELWSLVRTEVAPRFETPKSETELRGDFERAMARITERLGPPRKGMAPEDAVAAVSPLRVLRLSEVAVEAVVWLWHRYLPAGAITLFDGNPGEGKSTVVADLIARVTCGTEWPDGTPVGEPGDVVYVTKEDDPATQVRPRIEAAGGDVSRVAFVAADLLFPRDLPRFREVLDQVRPRLVLLDPLMSYLEGKVRAISDNEVRSALMTPLAELARDMGCAMLVIRHFNKGTGQSALNRGAGSLGGLAGAARMVLALAPDPDDDDGRTRVFGVVKSNYEARPPSMKAVIESAPVEGFHMTVSRVAWLGASDTAVADLMERTREQHHQVLEAEEALREVLVRHADPMPSGDVFAAMKAKGHPRNATYAAASALHVHRERVGFPSRTMWSLPVAVAFAGHRNGSRPPVVPDEDDWRTTEESPSRPDSGTTGTPGDLADSALARASAGAPPRAAARRRAGAGVGPGTSTTDDERDDWDPGEQSSHSYSSRTSRAHAAARARLTVPGHDADLFRAHQTSIDVVDGQAVCRICEKEEGS
jgi:hypothetical protein